LVGRKAESNEKDVKNLKDGGSQRRQETRDRKGGGGVRNDPGAKNEHIEKGETIRATKGRET